LQDILSDPLNETEPNVEFTDFHNGTTLTIIDYGNGTLDRITETHVNKTAKLRVVNETASQLLSLPTSEEECTDYKNSTQTVIMEQQLLMGFTHTLIKERWQWDVDKSWWIVTARVCVGVEFDIEFGLRLPVNVTIRYPEQMTVDHNYTFYATITAIDKPDYNESIFVFKTYAWLDAEVLGFTYHEEWGPNYDFSQSFKTPIGADMAFPFGSIPGPTLVDFEVLKIKLGLAPAFGSEKVTAKTEVMGDVILIDGANMSWSSDNQSLAFTVQASDCDPTTDNATIRLWDFRYYLTRFWMGFDLIFDFIWPLDTIISDFSTRVYTLDLSKLIEQFNLYLGVHEGYPESVHVDVFVERFGVQIIQVNPPSVNIKSTETAIFEVFVVNTGNVNDTFKLSLQGIPDNWWYNFSKTQFELKPGNMTKSQLSIKPPESVTQGQFSYNVTTCSLTAPSHDLEATDFKTITINISPAPPPEIRILSPQNKTYAIRNVPLNFTVDKPTSWMGYSLDSEENITITGNTTLVSLSEGSHNIIVYANDTSGNMGSSSQVYFTILIPVHDVAVISVVPSVNAVYQGDLVNIEVTVKNNGTEHETFDVTAYYDDEVIGTKSGVSLNSFLNKTIMFSWDTSSVSPGNYTLKGEASQVPDETDINNNVKINGQIIIKKPPPTRFKLTVNVTDNMGNPISNAKVEVNGETKITDGGMVEFTLEKGNYTVTASKEDYNPVSANISLNQDTTLVLILILPHGPTAEFTVTPETANVGESVKFNATSSLPGWNGTYGILITEYRWDFGDGNETTTYTPIVYHSFSSSGNYYVTLTVYAPGATPEIDTISHKVTIISVPVGGYSVPIQLPTTVKPATPYMALLTILTAILITIKRKTKRKH